MSDATMHPTNIDALPVAHVRRGGDGTAALDLMVDGIHCAGCVARIERHLGGIPGVVAARVNLTTRRLAVRWREGLQTPQAIVAAVEGLGYGAVPYDPERLASASDAEGRFLLRCLAVAGFAAGNVMLLSVSVWSGAFSDMGPATRDLLHWISALIALPAIAWAGRPFFRGALRAWAARRADMDIPISVGVVLTAGVSLFETMRGGEHAYFDAAITLLFFLLVGRVLDRLARARARGVAENMLSLSATAATVVAADGHRRRVPVEALVPGMIVAVAPGDRMPVDGIVREGRSEVDTSLVTGESLPRSIGPGDAVFAGTANLSGALSVSVGASGEGTLLAEIVRLMEAAEQGRARYVRLADRVARAYAPVVHLLAVATLGLWWGVLDAPFADALLTAVAVLIITCPCALGLAVPAVQVVASGRLMRRGILLKSADGLEKLAQVDMVVFDKTGTLTTGDLALVEAPGDAGTAALAARLAAASRHPLARALVRAQPMEVLPLPDVTEVPGEGLRAAHEGHELRLGSRAFCGVGAETGEEEARGPELWFRGPRRAPVRFGFADTLRPDAADTVGRLMRAGFAVELLSGDRPGVVATAARQAGITHWRACCRPAEKAARLSELAASGHVVLMVGDGLNDAPALAAAFVSMSPSTAADISRTAADAVFQGECLGPVLEALTVARRARRLVLQNFALAFGYNLVAVPLAVAGFVTPLVAAIAMSTSSIAVTANALRLALGRRTGREAAR